jgi:hypothetical protein
MNFAFTRSEQARRTVLTAALAETHNALTKAIAVYNAAVAEAGSELEHYVDPYNAALGKARDFVQQIKSRADEAFEPRSERWREGERGKVVAAWIEQIGECDCGDFEPEIQEIDGPSDDDVTAFLDLPVSPDANAV